MSDHYSNFSPVSTRDALIQLYAEGVREFPRIDLSEVDLSGVTLDDAKFEKHSWFFCARFDGASLRRVSFRECNVKCASFKNADLEDASFEEAAVESAEFGGAKLKGVRFVGATSYGYTILEEDEWPPV